MKIEKTYRQLAINLQINEQVLSSNEKKMDKFLEALADDFNTANAVTELFAILKEVNVETRKNPLNFELLRSDFATLKDMLDIFGLDVSYPVLSSEDKELFQKYNALKKEKRFEESDVIRQELMNKGLLL